MTSSICGTNLTATKGRALKSHDAGYCLLAMLAPSIRHLLNLKTGTVGNSKSALLQFTCSTQRTDVEAKPYRTSTHAP